jgi:hypothetical protein
MANPNLTFVIHGIKHPKRKLTRWILCLNIVPFKR